MGRGMCLNERGIQLNAIKVRGQKSRGNPFNIIVDAIESVI